MGSKRQGFNKSPVNSIRILFDCDCALTESEFSKMFSNMIFHIYIAISWHCRLLLGNKKFHTICSLFRWQCFLLYQKNDFNRAFWHIFNTITISILTLGGAWFYSEHPGARRSFGVRSIRLRSPSLEFQVKILGKHLERRGNTVLICYINGLLKWCCARQDNTKMVLLRRMDMKYSIDLNSRFACLAIKYVWLDDQVRYPPTNACIVSLRNRVKSTCFSVPYSKNLPDEHSL